MSHEHEWKRLPPHVVPLGESWRFGGSKATYNAECVRCGIREWLHWPPQRFKGRS